MCLYPKLIYNRKYIANKKNGGVIPAISDTRVLYVPVGCGKCMECKKKKGREWQIRLAEEIRNNKNGKFVTLTFSTEQLKYIIEGKDMNGKKICDEIKLNGYERDNEICTIAVRRFLERWRKKHKKSVRHWLVTELGSGRNEHVHIHGVIWTDEKKEEIENIWGYGFGYIKDKTNGGWVNEQTINYIVKYIHKTDEKHKEYNSKILCSQGIGKGYTERRDSENNKYKGDETNELYRNRQGYEMALPIYYRNKIYTEDEKEKLWLKKLDENKRWIGGEEIKADDEENINKLLEYYRKKNNELGYGNDEKNWERKRYENNRRNLIVLNRIKTEEKKEKKELIIPDERNINNEVKGGRIEDAF